MLWRVVIIHKVNRSARINIIINNENDKFNIFRVRFLRQIWKSVNLLQCFTVYYCRVARLPALQIVWPEQKVQRKPNVLKSSAVTKSGAGKW